MARTDIVEFDINPVFLYEHGACAVDTRFYIDTTASPEQPEMSRALQKELHQIKSIALIGASAEPNKVGYAVLRNLLSFPGTVYPANPKHTVILGRTTYPSLTSTPARSMWLSWLSRQRLSLQ
ncbi:MAG: CoA-binding protein [Methanoregula sp.]